MPIVAPINKFVCHLPKASGIPRDVVMNTWYTDSVTSPSAVATALRTFYNAWIPGYGASCLTNTLTIDYYQMPATPGPTGPPVATFTEGLSSSGAVQNFPNEVSCALSFHSDMSATPEHGPGKTRPRASLRGRVYLGPLSITAGQTEGTAPFETFLASGLITALKGAAAAFHTSVSWVQWSHKNWNALPVVGGWIDNRFDSTRRREQDATLRTPWP